MENKPDNPCSLDWGLDDLHNKMLEILNFVKELCTENNVDFCLAYGTALGAFRHKGFIPWDDDADIYMTKSNYYRFREAFLNRNNQDKFYLQEIGAVDGMVTVAKLRMNGTTLIEPLYENYDMHQGMYIDIFVLFDAPDNYKIRRKMFFASQYLMLKGLSNRHYQGNLLVRILLSLMRLQSHNAFRKIALRELYDQSNEGRDYFDIDRRTFQKSFISKDIVFPSKEVEFCGEKFPAPNNLELYLRLNYGDYMQIPSVEEIQYSQHAGFWKVDEDFRNYAPNIDSFKDEKNTL